MKTSSFSPTDAIGFGWNTVMRNKKFWIIIAFMAVVLSGSKGTNFSNDFSKDLEEYIQSDSNSPDTSDYMNEQYNMMNNNVNIQQNMMMDDSYMMEETESGIPLVPKQIDDVLGISDQRDSGNMAAFILLAILVIFLFSIPFIVMSIFISTAINMGFLKLYITAAKGGETKYEHILSEVKGGKAVQFLLANFLYGLLVIFGLILFIIPGIYFMLKYMFVPYAVVDKNATIGDAFGLSSQATKGNKLNLFGLFILAILINIVGLLAFIYGLVITIPVTSLAYAYAYHRLTNGGISPSSKSEKLSE